MHQSLIDRINYLAKKMKTEGLTEEEAAERKELHKQYIAAYRENLRATLENTYIQRPDGTREKVKQKDSE